MKKVFLSLLIPVSFISSQAHAFNDWKLAGGIAAGVVSAVSMGAAVKFVNDHKKDPVPSLAPLFALPLAFGSISAGVVSALLIADPSLPVQNCSVPVRVGVAIAKIVAGTVAAGVSTASGIGALSLAKDPSEVGKYMKAGLAVTSVATGILSYLALNSALNVNVSLKY